MRFEWDETKNIANLAKHDLSFETARDVFDDPFHVSKLDQVVNGEQRWKTIGVIGALSLIVVAHTYWDDDGDEIVRIISARIASRHERREYENG
jgi:uncharacterized protein